MNDTGFFWWVIFMAVLAALMAGCSTQERKLEQWLQYKNDQQGIYERF